MYTSWTLITLNIESVYSPPIVPVHAPKQLGVLLYTLSIVEFTTEADEYSNTENLKQFAMQALLLQHKFL